MPQFQIHLQADREEAERIASLLEDEFEDEGVPVSWYETAEGWAVDAFPFADTADEAADRVRDVLGADGFGAPMTVTALDETTDWVSISLDGLKPVVAGRFVVHGQHDRNNLPAGLIGLHVEANQAFGTGHHPTTWGCLVALSRLLKVYRFDSVFDLGTGSGVLAIAVAKDTRRFVLASDIDPLSVAIARENAEINGVARRLLVVEAAGFAHPDVRGRLFDLVVANILASPLKQLAPEFRARTRPGAVIVLSGILAVQAPSVLAAFRVSGFARIETILKDGWTTLVMRRIAL